MVVVPRSALKPDGQSSHQGVENLGSASFSVG